MCGINVIIDKKNQLTPSNILKMNRALAHRGPDTSEYKTFPFGNHSIYLGHTRLKIMDLSDRANQPMTIAPDRYFLIFNGEIYNFYELRNELVDLGCQFTTSSDTEVLLQWLICKGSKGLTSLRGMFAFVLIDVQENTLLCARDPAGMKPFFYFENETYFIISSEIHGLLASDLINRELNIRQVHHYLNFRHTLGPDTFFQNIFELSPGHQLTWSGEKNILRFHHHSNSGEPEANDKNIRDHVEELLIDAVGTHWVADVPVGLFLSGGIDSTLLLALLKTHYGQKCRTFAITHRRREGSFGTQDGHFARLAARQFGTIHEELEAEPGMLSDFQDFISKLDQPVGDSAALLTFFLSELAKRSVGVVLSGAGADEWFGGYNRHLAYFKYLKNYGIYTKLIPPLKKVLNWFPSGYNHPFRKNFQLWKKFATSIDPDPTQTFQNMTSFGFTEHNGAFAHWNKEFTGIDRVDHYLGQGLDYDRQNYLVNDILNLNDRMTMRHSLEMRMPYLSHNLTQYMHNIPPACLLAKGRKWLLKELLKKYEGQAFVNRSKEGFGLPFGNWLRNGKANHLLEFLYNEKSIIFETGSKELIINQLKNHNEGKADNTLFLWSVIVLGNWLEIHFG